MVAQGTERLWWTKSYKIMSDRGVSREQLVPIFPNTKHCNEHPKSSGKKFQASKGKIPENAQLPFKTQGLSRSWSPKGQTGSKSRETRLWKRRMLCETQRCRGVFSKKSWGQTLLEAGRLLREKSLLGIPQAVRGMDQPQGVSSSTLITS